MKSYLRTTPILLLWLFVGLALAIYLRSLCLAYSHGGPITDDSVDLLGAFQHLDLYTKLFSSDARQNQVVMDLGFYGQLPKYIYLIPWILLQKTLHPEFSIGELSAIYQASWFTPPEKLSSFTFSSYTDPLQYLYSHIHLFNAAYFFGLLVLAGASSYTVSKSKLSIPLAVILILAFPHISGLSLFDSKDLPVAFFYTLFSYACVSRASHCNGQFTPDVLIIGSAALLTSLKIVFWPVTAITLIILTLSSPQSRNVEISPFNGSELRKTLLSIVLIGTISIVFNPYILAHPLPRVIEAFHLFSNHSNLVKTLIHGQIVTAADQDWSTITYILRWISIITPTYVLVLTATSYLLLSLLLLTRSETSLVRSLYPFLAQAWLMPLLAILNNSNVYDGMRHFIFSLTSSCIITSSILAAYLNSKRSDLRALVFSISIVIGLILPLGDTFTLSPYQYTYKNEYSRTSPIGIYSDADFWLFGAKELLATISAKDLRISHFDGSSWDYSRLWVRYFGHELDMDGQVLSLFDRGEKLLRKTNISCKRSYNLKRSYWLGSSQLIIGSGTGCIQ